jgi:hypothetical protein
VLRTLAVLLLGILACADSGIVAPLAGEPDSPPVVPPTAPAPKVGANYALVLVNGAPLPSASPTGAGQWDYDGAQVKLVGATLAIYTDGTLVEWWEHRSSRDWSVSFSQTCPGRYTRISESTLQVGVGEGATFVTLTATGLVWKVAGFTLTYELQQ